MGGEKQRGVGRCRLRIDEQRGMEMEDASRRWKARECWYMTG